MGKIVKLELNEEDYKKITNEALKNKDYLKAIVTAKESLTVTNKPASVYLSLARIYESIDSSSQERTCLFKALACNPEGGILNDIKFDLAVSYLKDGDKNTAEYYVPDILNEFETFETSFNNPKFSQLKLFDRKSEEFNDELYDEGMDAIQDGEYNRAIECFSQIDKDSAARSRANYMLLIVLLMKDDMNAVIDNGERMLIEDPDNLAVQCTLATSYLSEKQQEKGKELLDKILSKKYDTIEAAFLVTPLLANFKMHDKVLEFSKIVLDKGVVNPPAYIWYAEALYNVGRKQESYSLFKKLDLCFGDEFPIKYYLSQIDDGKNELDYVVTYPPEESALRLHLLKKYLKIPKKELDILLDSNSKKGELTRKIFEWAFEKNDNKIKHIVIDKISDGDSEWGRMLLCEQLMNHTLGTDLITHDFIGVVNMSEVVDVDVVSGGRYNHVYYVKPKCIGKLNKLFSKLFCFSVANVLHSSDNPSLALEKLNKILEVVCPLDENDERIENERTKQIDKLRSLRTVIAVVESRMNHKESNEPKKDMLKIFNVSEKMFDKYNKIIFGE